MYVAIKKVRHWVRGPGELDPSDRKRSRADIYYFHAASRSGGATAGAAIRGGGAGARGGTEQQQQQQQQQPRAPKCARVRALSGSSASGSAPRPMAAAAIGALAVSSPAHPPARWHAYACMLRPLRCGGRARMSRRARIRLARGRPAMRCGMCCRAIYFIRISDTACMCFCASASWYIFAVK
jgi:hypothetical protein